MTRTPYSHSQNQLLTMLPAPSRRQLFSKLELVPLVQNYRIASKGEIIKYVYFMNSGVGSVIASSSKGRISETGIIGNDGFAPLALSFGIDRSPFDIIVQCEGDGFRMKADAFQEIASCDPVVAQMALRYAHIFLIQAACTAHSNALDRVEVRLARWLLMCHDRIWGNKIALTHEYLALMLAVRRPSVTTALHVLEGNGYIRSTRGEIFIRDRKALEQFVGSSYGHPEQEYADFVHWMESERHTWNVDCHSRFAPQ
ncbi:Crp/Fnr family transcriptional regulator [Agrobacterium larrymoorei]|uniref:Crp/Fnr family transcriptional regulator n=1 Tax=Agrobacterium larrymoorei TaxID=160699 RepID=A0A4D7DX82_9HYPH|nr:Crp/Fnr family transcriptional regulator [Agrobacterium larrymoorei]QCJ00889.1 Crp/Fnr family transcriptional regulator [Agrobacterium larrymoorei]QYA10225.1 Crp/Fnr family transcriptional regulator [Agrobacterium larrymoorei]